MKSKKWKQWTIADYEDTCLTCIYNNGKIYPIYADVSADIPAHGFCRCYTSPLAAIYAGEATINGTTGADWYLKYFNELPEYYITKTEKTHMKKIIIDFNGCRTYHKFHQILKESFDFPNYYGENLDALWDCLDNYCDFDLIVEIKGFNSLPKELKQYIPKVMNVFDDVTESTPNIKFVIIS